MRTHHIPYPKLRDFLPGLFLSFVTDDGRAGKLFARRYRDEKQLLERAKKAAEKGIEKEVLENIRFHHASMKAPTGAREALDRLGRGAAMVIAGQQPSVGWGPLYNFYKAQAALKYAQAIEARGIPCVAAFWNHSDDSRVPTPVGLPDRENLLREFPIPEGPANAPLYNSGVDEAIGRFRADLSLALPTTEFSPWVAQILDATQKGTVAESFTRLLMTLLGPYGLIVLEPRHLQGERSEKFFSDHLSQPDRLSKAVEMGRGAVIGLGLDDHLGRDVGLDLFEIREGKRFRVDDPRKLMGRPSPGVALRPIFQDAVLPTCGFVAGPSEVGYLAALGPAYRAFGVDQPVIFPRVTATLIEPKIARIMDKFGIASDQMFESESVLQECVGRHEPDLAADLRKISDETMARVDGLLKGLGDPGPLGKAREKTEAKVKEAFDALAGRVRDEMGRREDTGRGQLMKLLTHLRPGGQLQERSFTPLYYLSLFGPSFADNLLATLDPFIFAHQVVGLP